MSRQLYLDSVEIALMNAGFGFIGTCRPKPDEGLTQLVQIDEAVWGMEPIPSNTNFNFVRCNRLDGAGGDQAKYVDALVEIYGIDMSKVENRQIVESSKRIK